MKIDQCYFVLILLIKRLYEIQILICYKLFQLYQVIKDIRITCDGTNVIGIHKNLLCYVIMLSIHIYLIKTMLGQGCTLRTFE